MQNSGQPNFQSSGLSNPMAMTASISNMTQAQLQHYQQVMQMKRPTIQQGQAISMNQSQQGTQSGQKTSDLSTRTAKKRKATEARLFGRSLNLIPESPLLNEMQATERKIDLLLARKTEELVEMYASFKRGPPGTAAAMGAVKKRLRVYIFHQRHNDNEETMSHGLSEEPAHWSIHIQGRLMDAESNAPPSSQQQMRRPFSEYLKRLKVEFADESIVWEKIRHDGPHRESFEVRRLGKGGPPPMTLTFDIDHAPQLYKVSSDLARLLDLHEGRLHSLPTTLQMLWAYIKSNNLLAFGGVGLESSSLPIITCNPDLSAVLGGLKELSTKDLNAAVKTKLTRPDPVVIQYVPQESGPSLSRPIVYDFDMAIPLCQDLPQHLLKLPAEYEMNKFEAYQNNLLAKYAEHKRRRNYFLAFSQSPYNFIRALALAQDRELRQVKNKDGEIQSFEVLAAAEIFKQRWADDAVLAYLVDKVKQPETEKL